MWDRVHEKDTRDAEEREREIRNHNWNILSTAGAGVMRFDNTAKSAHRITKKIVEERVSGDAVYELRKNVMEELSNLVSVAFRSPSEPHPTRAEAGRE